MFKNISARGLELSNENMRHLKYYSVVLLIFNFGNVRATEGLPCGINQSTNITGAFIHSNGSAIFQSQVYPEGSYGQFHNSLFEEVSEINKNATHLRGCFCHLRGKPCLPFCCPPGFVKRSGGETCYDYTHEPYVKTSSRVDRKVIKARDKFRLVHGVPCCSNATLSNDVDWELFDVSLVVFYLNFLILKLFLEWISIFT